MPPEQDELLVDISEQPAGDDKRAETVVDAEEKPAVREIPAEEGVEALRKQLETERAARIAAEARAHEASRVAVSAQNEVQDSNLTLVENAIETVTSNLTNLKAQYAAASQAGDHEALASLTEAMTKSNNQLADLERGRDALQAQPKKEVPPPRAPINDPVEALASSLSPRSADWIRAHPEFARDKVKFQKMIAAHNLVTAGGETKGDTDEYFEKVEDLLGIRRTAPVIDDDTGADDPQKQTARVVQRRGESPPAAPVSRGGGGPGSGGKNVVRLTAMQREAAAASGLTDQEYARNLVALKKEGKIGA
jgi:hypothetical protein